MSYCIDSALNLHDLETYIKVHLDDPRNAGADVDPILDIMLWAKGRIDRGDHEPRAVCEAMARIDEYLINAAIESRAASLDT